MKIHLLIKDTDTGSRVLSAYLDRANAESARMTEHRGHWEFHQTEWRESGYFRSWEQHWKMANEENWSPRIEEIEVADDQEGMPEFLLFLHANEAREAVQTVMEVSTSQYRNEPHEAEAEARDLADAVLQTLRRTAMRTVPES